MSDTEHDDLDALISSPGWLRLKAYAQAEYGPQILGRVALEEDDGRALLKLRQAKAIHEAINVLLEYPLRRMRELKPPAETRQPFARGGL